ncbi:nuclear transport factor 2 family protein [Sphingobium sp. BS19]|uniref:nuclear transport factor 2 family protein n=1 Tax=Sphingobium sp. BS19 TaxID=3018973 RepID=UPI00249388A7|nr:nuclear transport factor 2 family protein [Sphingobium sp. BS19]
MDQTKVIVSTEEIRCLKSRYFRAIDLKDGLLLRSLFTDDVSVDLRGAATDPASGVNALPGATSEIITGLDNVMTAYLESLNGLVSVHHGLWARSPFSMMLVRKASGRWPTISAFPAGQFAG